MTGSGILPPKISEIYNLIEGLQGRLNSASKEESDFLSKAFEEIKTCLKEFSAAGEENERHLKEAERRASELNATISSIADGVITYSPNGEIISMNRAAQELLGISPEDSNRMTPLERMRLLKVKTAEGEEQEPGQSPLVRALRGETVRNSVRIIENPRDGRVIWTDNSAAPMYSADGRLQGVVATFTDITERKRIDKALRESKQRFRDAIDNFPNVFVIYDADRRIKYVNSKGLQIIGCSEQEVIGRKDEEIFPPEMIDSYLPALKRAIETKTSQTLERTRPARMGGQTIIANIIPLLNERGEIRQILGISYDISERKLAEKALCASEERMRLFFERQVVGMAITSTKKGWLQVNDKLCQMLGYSREELENLTWAELTHPEDLAADIDQFDQILAGIIDGYSMEKRFIHKDGKIVHTQLSVGCVRRPDKTVDYVLALLADITERKQMEEELRRSRNELEQRVQERTAELSRSREELEVVNEELQVELTQHERLEKDLITAKEAAEEAVCVKAAFMANMSHELRTPMNAVIGMTSLLLDEKLTPEQNDYVETIRSGGESLMALINNILDFSKMEREETEIELQDIDLRRHVEEALDLLAKNASEKDLDLAYTFEDGMPEVIIGDPARLRQVLVNLLSNAIKFTDHGEVVLTVTPEQNAKIRFSVRDTGIGIPPDKMKLLFLPFSQVDMSITRGYDGAGLGLAISKKLVELMGGKIWAESEDGKGSTFHFTIKGEAVSAKPKPFPGALPQLEGKSVLIIEDKRATRRVLGQQILSWDMIPTIASSTQEIPKLVEGENAYDAVILDVDMPGADEMVETIHERGLPVVAIVSIGQHADNKFAASISKPVKPAQIYGALSKTLTQRIQDLQSVEAGEKTDYGPLCILLAEDNKSNRKVTLQMLRKLGYRADAVANGAEAVEALKRQHYDLILMDVKMPVMNGIESAREIRKLWPDNGPKIIALTAYALAGDREKCIEAGMDGYLSKPVQLNDMADILARQRCP
jgi:PAS domain S-box-containing protein